MLKIKNWPEFQHYRNRRPPWIKLHHSLLDDFEFHSLPVASRALAPMLWLLASENLDGSISDDLSEIGFRLRMTVEQVQTALKPLLDKGFVVSESNVLADCKQSAMPETEAKTETEARKPSVSSDRKSPSRHKQGELARPVGVSDAVWSDYLQIRKAKRAPITETALAQIRREAEKAEITLQTALEHCCTRGWQSFKAEWLGDKKASTQPANEFEGAL